MPPVVTVSPATLSGFHAGRAPRNKGMRYPADPPTVEEIVAVLHAAGMTTHGQRLRALIVVLWRAGLRISEALALDEADREWEQSTPARDCACYRQNRRRVGCQARPVGIRRDKVAAW
jgi:integrase